MATDLFDDTELERVPNDSPPKRRRRTRVVRPDALPTVEGEETAAPKRTRRSRKMKGSDVVTIVTKGCGWYAGLASREHWIVAPSEVEPWADEAAELLNKLPASYVRAAVDFSGYAVVLYGIVSVFGPRLMMDRMLARMAAEQAAGTAPPTGNPNGTEPRTAESWLTAEHVPTGD
jgi:hypothetical protein